MCPTQQSCPTQTPCQTVICESTTICSTQKPCLTVNCEDTTTTYPTQSKNIATEAIPILTFTSPKNILTPNSLQSSCHGCQQIKAQPLDANTYNGTNSNLNDINVSNLLKAVHELEIFTSDKVSTRTPLSYVMGTNGTSYNYPTLEIRADNKNNSYHAANFTSDKVSTRTPLPSVIVTNGIPYNYTTLEIHADNKNHSFHAGGNYTVNLFVKFILNRF